MSSDWTSGVGPVSAEGAKAGWAGNGDTAQEWAQKPAVLGSWLAKQMADPRKGPGHDFILKIGHLLGHKFRPYEAVRWAERVGKAGEVAAKWAPFVAVVASAAMQAHDEYAERKRLQELRDAQEEIRGLVAAAADSLIAYVRELTVEPIEDAFAEMRTPLEAARADLDDEQDHRDDAVRAIEDIRARAEGILVKES